ncbi:hypothetical protein L596_003514 [Steinernema carpocapsae]|uniref:Uncharacterized protein n=1 Tax=Steinernema carpocapsae TaxID=34508 RepID=A0A4V6I7S2_STECR|nr:hypothetical protein L596_003514 [Steinernema carpocapsae]
MLKRQTAEKIIFDRFFKHEGRVYNYAKTRLAHRKRSRRCPDSSVSRGHPISLAGQGCLQLRASSPTYQQEQSKYAKWLIGPKTFLSPIRLRAGKSTPEATSEKPPTVFGNNKHLSLLCRHF